MKIIKFPSENIITCKCGCEFEFDEKDVKRDILYLGTVAKFSVYICCPFCSKKHLLKEYESEITSY